MPASGLIASVKLPNVKLSGDWLVPRGASRGNNRQRMFFPWWITSGWLRYAPWRPATAQNRTINVLALGLGKTMATITKSIKSKHFFVRVCPACLPLPSCETTLTSWASGRQGLVCTCAWRAAHSHTHTLRDTRRLIYIYIHTQV